MGDLKKKRQKNPTLEQLDTMKDTTLNCMVRVWGKENNTKTVKPYCQCVLVLSWKIKV